MFISMRACVIQGQSKPKNWDLSFLRKSAVLLLSLLWIAVTSSHAPEALSNEVRLEDAKKPMAKQTARKNAVSARKTLKQVDVQAVWPGYLTQSTSTATKTNTWLRDVPQSISVVPKKMIHDQAAQSLSDVVRYVPGILFAQGEGHRDAPVLRGNTSTSDFYVDGVKDDVQYFRDPYNAEQIEVIKGPNALMFGRGGTGGVINRVTKLANDHDGSGVNLSLGSWAGRRVDGDWNSAVDDQHAVRVTGVYEDSDSFRQEVGLQRWGLNPSLRFQLNDYSSVTLSYEHFEDERTVDRGIPSFQGRSINSNRTVFYGDPKRSFSDADIDSLSAALEHRFENAVLLRNRFRYADYTKFYQNVFPGSVNSTASQVQISAYNNLTERQNALNQTDVEWTLDTGAIQHQFLMGAEIGKQATDNVRKTGFFTSISPTTTSILVPLSAPTIDASLHFAPNASDADQSVDAFMASVYVQDQIKLSPQWLAVLGARYDRFSVDLENNRDQTRLKTTDTPVSPRVGLIYKPEEVLSIYTSYSSSYQPRAGEQLASLTPGNQALDPETFKNYELGAKWDISPSFAATLAWFRLDRGNVAVTDPSDVSRSILVDGQRVQGLELGFSGNLTDAWQVIGGYAYQNAEVTHTQSTSALEGAKLALVPEHSFSVWNRYDWSSNWGAGVGLIHRSKVFTTTDNLVSLPGFVRVDAALYHRLSEQTRIQLNIENIFDKKYDASAHNNNNISPGAPRSFRLLVGYEF
jgi:catecholate siderophore receptor